MADVAQTFALNPYAAEQAKIERLQKYAELLQSQGLAPEQKFGYAGIEAPPSAAGALAKGLQLGVSGYLQGRGMRKADELSAKAQTESKEFIDTLTGKPGEVAPTRGLGISDFEDRQVVGGKYDPEAGPQKLATALSGNIPVAPGQGDVVPGSAPLAGPERTAALLRGAVSGNPMIAPLASSLYAKDIEPPKLEKLGEDESGLIYNKDTKRFEPLGGAGPKKPYMGKDLNAQDRNILLTGNPSSPEYAASYAAMATPKTIKDDQGQVFQIYPDMTPYKPPRSIVPNDAVISGAGTPIRPAAPPPGAVAVDVPNANRPRLPSGEVEKITAIDNSYGTQSKLMETYQDEFGGYGAAWAGDLKNFLAARTDSPEGQKQAQWWASHYANDSVARNALFGASLTPGEAASWERTTINPGMDSGMIRSRMKERADLIAAKRATTLENFSGAGYDVKDLKMKPSSYLSGEDRKAYDWAKAEIKKNPNNAAAKTLIEMYNK